MVSLVMYSDQVIPENDKVDALLLNLMAGRGRRIGYVPSGPEPDRRFFRERQAYYANLDFNLSVFFDTAGPLDEAELATLLDCDAIHLSGGNTRVFLHILKTNNLLPTLAEWARNEGLLIGTSAGAILMTPTVALDAMFSGEDPEAVHDGGALDLVPFEFFRHDGKRADQAPILRCRVEAGAGLCRKRNSNPVVPENLHQVTSTSTENVQVCGIRIVTRILLNLQRKRVHATPHVRYPGRKPDTYATRNRNAHTTSRRRAKAAASKSFPAKTRRPFALSISMRPQTPDASATTAAVTKPEA